MSSCSCSYDNFSYCTNDSIFIWHINNGKSEPYPRELDLVKLYLSMYPNYNNIFIDVGGHIGTTSLPYSRLFKKCIAYEPNKESYNFFIDTIKVNNIKNIELYNKGVYNKTTNCIVLPHSDSNSGCYYIKECLDIDNMNKISVVKLDDVHFNTKIDFIKIDTEGSELYVLEGAIEIIKKWKPLIQIETNECSDKYFGYNKEKIFRFIKDLKYEVFNDDGNNPLFYYPKNKIYCFWTGDNKMSDNRIKSLENLRDISETEIILVTKDNIKDYILDTEPLHPAYDYLSETHKSDYLRTYFMNFYGGGYSDVKMTSGSWKQCFYDLLISDKWICGYKEIDGCVAYKPLQNEWSKLVGNGAYICKPQTELTKKWYNEMLLLLDTKLEELKINPSTKPDDCAETGSGYPIEWNEMLGRIFHKVTYNYIDKIINTLPLSIFNNYK